MTGGALEALRPERSQQLVMRAIRSREKKMQDLPKNMGRPPLRNRFLQFRLARRRYDTLASDGIPHVLEQASHLKLGPQTVLDGCEKTSVQ